MFLLYDCQSSTGYPCGSNPTGAILSLWFWSWRYSSSSNTWWIISCKCASFSISIFWSKLRNSLCKYLQILFNTTCMHAIMTNKHDKGWCLCLSIQLRLFHIPSLLACYYSCILFLCLLAFPWLWLLAFPWLCILYLELVSVQLRKKARLDLILICTCPILYYEHACSIALGITRNLLLLFIYSQFIFTVQV